MLIWNVLITWLMLVVSAAAYSPSLFESHCPACGGILRGYERLELLCQIGDRFIGWQTIRCTHCSQQQTTLGITRDRRTVLYQTHPVLT